MIDRLKTRIAREESGFTLIELLVVIIILGILLAIAIPSYLSFKDRANKSAAMSNVRSAVPSVEAYNADNNGQAGDADNDANTNGYTGMTYTALKTGVTNSTVNPSGYDQALSASVHIRGDNDLTGVTAGAAPSTTTYCVYAVQGNWYAWKAGPSADIKSGTAIGSVCT